MNRATFLRTLATATFALCLGVVVLGAWVRLSAAGLGCPDWPGCYGHLSPTGAVAEASATGGTLGGAVVEAGKAWKEMIHRYAAGTLGALIVAIASLAILWRREQLVSVPYAVALAGIVILQGLFGALTVTWRLKPIIVTGHLLFGLCTLGMLWWLVLTLYRRRLSGWRHGPAFVGTELPGLRLLALLALLGVILQIALGGWTSSNYAATACPDFPRCQGAWWPVGMDMQGGFVLWHGLGINYEGGVLANAARVAIQFTHRLGAVGLTLLLLFVAVRVRRTRADNFARRAALLLLVALGLQLLIGAAMVLRGFPLWIATLHNAGAALLLLAAIALNRSLRPAWKAA
jgi:cytochrome c oxidase assembly protein subunit 15